MIAENQKREIHYYDDRKNQYESHTDRDFYIKFARVFLIVRFVYAPHGRTKTRGRAVYRNDKRKREYIRAPDACDFVYEMPRRFNQRIGQGRRNLLREHGGVDIQKSYD